MVSRRFFASAAVARPTASAIARSTFARLQKRPQDIAPPATLLRRSYAVDLWNTDDLEIDSRPVYPTRVWSFDEINDLVEEKAEEANRKKLEEAKKRKEAKEAEAIKHQAEEVIEETPDETIENESEETIENKSEEAIENKTTETKSDEAIEKKFDEPEEFIENKYDENMEKKPEENIVIVDVREPVEIFETGKIPGAINIPITTAVQSFHILEEDFEELYGFERPSKNTELIFYCKAGVRARSAAAIAKTAGFKKVGEYPGSWLEWEKKRGPIERVFKDH